MKLFAFPTFFLLTSAAIRNAAADHCGPGEMQIHVGVNIKTGDFPEENVFELRDECTGFKVLSEGPFDEYNTLHEFDYCVPRGRYTFSIFDSYGDGLDGTPPGYYELYVDGIEVARGSDDDFNGKESTTFGGTCGPRQCGPGQMQLHVSVDIQTGSYPEENSFQLVNECTGAVEVSEELLYAHTELLEFDYCLPRGRYTFTIFDSYGDGIDGNPAGYYEVDADGALVARGSDFGSEESTTFGSCDTSGGMGDPHFQLWSGEWYDFHGQCDMVMVDAPGLDLLVHVRTTIRYDYSYIESVGIKAGPDVLEVGSFGDYFVNGVASAAMPTKISNFPVTYAVGKEDRQHIFEIELNGDARIVVKSFKDMLSVKFFGTDAELFGGSLGLIGEFGTGKKLARDKKTVIEDSAAFAQEWQVLEEEPHLFQLVRAPQYPETCIFPDYSKAMQRRLGEKGVSRQAAEEACAQWKDSEKEMCIFDALATGNLETAAAGGF